MPPDRVATAHCARRVHRARERHPRCDRRSVRHSGAQLTLGALAVHQPYSGCRTADGCYVLRRPPLWRDAGGVRAGGRAGTDSAWLSGPSCRYAQKVAKSAEVGPAFELGCARTRWRPSRQGYVSRAPPAHRRAASCAVVTAGLGSVATGAHALARRRRAPPRSRVLHRPLRARAKSPSLRAIAIVIAKLSSRQRQRQRPAHSSVKAHH